MATVGPRQPWPRGVRALTTCRTGGLGLEPGATFSLGSGAGADPAAVAANRRRLRARLALPGDPVWLQQEHGTQVVALTAGQAHARPPVADAAVTCEPGVIGAIMTADCLPVVLAAADGSAVAVVHAGWRGLAAGVIEAALGALPVAPTRLHAWLGPAIGPTAFEVGPEVRAAFLATDPGHAESFRAGVGDRWFADLYGLARRRLHVAGVRHIDAGPWCTWRDRRRFFSHRRDQGRTGRMVTLAWIDP